MVISHKEIKEKTEIKTTDKKMSIMLKMTITEIKNPKRVEEPNTMKKINNTTTSKKDTTKRKEVKSIIKKKRK